MPEPIRLTVLGSGAAMPSKRAIQSSQLLSLKNKYIMIDCGEGAQIKMTQMEAKMARISVILISHLHGDHIFGLPGLLATMGMLGRGQSVLLVGPKGLEEYTDTCRRYAGGDFGFEVRCQIANTKEEELVYEDRGMEIWSFPLTHSMPCCGYRVSEKPGRRHLDKDALEKYSVPLSQYCNLQAGRDLVKEDGTVVPNELLTKPADKPRSYAYCCDTAYRATTAEFVRGVDVLYHDSTFASRDALRAKKTQHSTAAEAAKTAAEAGVGRLILGHISARYTDPGIMLEEAKAIFENTELARDGAKYYF